MPDLVLSRRRFLQTALASAGLACSGVLLSRAAAAQSLPAALVLGKQGIQIASSVKTDQAGHQLLSLLSTSKNAGLLPSGWRGHQAVASPDGRYLISVARRPGKQLLVQDLQTQQHYFFDGPEDRHFYGHGLFSADGKHLYCPENDFDNARGVIGIYQIHADAELEQTLQRVGEWDSAGVGPHQIAWVQHQQQTLMVVANGGIETHPDYPRIKLNLDSMQPNLSYFDLQGKLLEQIAAPHHQLSLRHLDVAPDGQVWVGAQYEGEIHESPNLIYSHRLGEKSLSAVQADVQLWPQLKAYIASVSCHSQTDTVCITAPRDNHISLWRRSTGELIKLMALPDCAGACAHPTEAYYLVSSGDGILAAYDANTGKHLWQEQFAGVHWDNHLSWVNRA